MNLIFGDGLKLAILVWFVGVLADKHIPPSWKNFCSVTTTRLEPVATSDTSALVVIAACKIRSTEPVQWKLNDLRNWSDQEKINFNTTAGKRHVIYKLKVTCQAGSKISIPWPMKIPGLLELNVSSCLLMDRYENFRSQNIADLPDELRILDIRDSQWLASKENEILSISQQSINISSAYECGNDETLEAYVTRNVSDILDPSQLQPTLVSLVNLTSTPHTITEAINQLPLELGESVTMTGTVKPETRLNKDAEKVISDHVNTNVDVTKSKPPTSVIGELMSKVTGSNGSSSSPEEEFLNLLRKVFNTKFQCNYVKLKVLDQSVSTLTPVTVFEFLVQGAHYPVLELMNFSSNGIHQFPRELSEWRRFFPKLTYIDLSNNLISQAQFQKFPSMKDTGVVTFNLQYNNITTINLDVLNSWADIEKLEVDIRNNPIHCGCEMGSFLPLLQDDDTFTGKLSAYGYIKYLECATPVYLQGKKLYSLLQSSLPCPVYPSHQAALIALGVTLFSLLVAVIFLVRYKVEIRILLYTRLHVRLPCDADELRHNKTYDAFISYSNEDDTWVLENLVNFLENSPVLPKQQVAKNGAAQGKGVEFICRGSGNRTRQFRLCIHQRDFVPGKTIFDNIVDSIEASRHTIIVLSPSFMRSHWAMEELRQAYRQSLVEKTRHLVVLLLHKVPKEEMDPLIARCCKTFTYLDVNDSLFKDRLIFSLTTKDRGSRRRDRLLSKKQSDPDDGHRLPVPQSPSQLESGVYDNIAYFPTISSPPESDKVTSGFRSQSGISLTQNGTRERPHHSSSTNEETLTSSQTEPGLYDSLTYYTAATRPPEAQRVMSNMSTTSTTYLIG